MTSISTLAPTTPPALRPTVAALPAYVAGRRAESALTAALASNESHFAPLPSVVDAIAAGAARANRYPDMASTALREAIATSLDVDLDQVAVGPGSSGVLQQIITAVCAAGDEVVFAWRSFEAYPILVSLAGATPVKVPLTAAEGHDLDAMVAAITERTRLVIVCSPNNPTGVPVPAAELRAALERIPSHVLVVIDEAYIEYTTDTTTGTGATTDTDAVDALSLLRTFPNVCVLRTFSKAHGLAGLRVGYAIAHPDVADGLRRTAIPFGVSSLAQLAAIASLDAAAVAEMRERTGLVARERDRVVAAARELGWTVPDGSANFVWLRVDDAERERLVAAFADAEILVRGYVGDGVRVSLADPASNDRVLAVLAGFAR